MQARRVTGEIMYRTLRVKLGSSAAPSDHEELEFHVRRDPTAQKWAATIAQAASESELHERDRFYSFPGHANANLENVIARMREVQERLSQLHPEVVWPEWNVPEADLDRVQSAVNELHTRFAHTFLVTHQMTDASRPLWLEFNILIHRAESVMQSARSLREHGIPNARVVFTWQNNFAAELSDEDYHKFEISCEFGTCYVNYCQTGRHILELFWAKDDLIPDEHVLPLRKLSADTWIWFGPTFGDHWCTTTRDAVKAWFMERREKFARLDLYWGDPRLAVGQIPVADLADRCSSLQRKRTMLEHLSRFDRIESVTVE